jgi:hypothetical protein
MLGHQSTVDPSTLPASGSTPYAADRYFAKITGAWAAPGMTLIVKASNYLPTAPIPVLVGVDADLAIKNMYVKVVVFCSYYIF